MSTSRRVAARIGERRVAPAAGWSVRFAGFALVLFAVAGLGHRSGLVETVAFLWTLALVAVLGITALVLSAWGFWRLWTFGDRAGRASLGGAVLAAIVLAPFALSLWRFATLPLVNDVSTDMADPPAIAGQPVPDAAARRAVVEAYPQVNGRRYTATADRVMEAIVALVARRGWTVESAPPPPLPGGEATIRVRAVTPLLGFPVRVALRVADEGETTFVDMRSAGVHGRHDLGDNAARVRRFLEDLDTVMAAEAAL
ncbi:MAG: DUF1499 domain-containing protein [Rhizobiaceae bacterium]|nr:DUF1499 domain-containing protein [Rhizobiaceae bacterium]MCV0408165.1 DUF1499 domain-containing protein [Rhizobiaceae bacterium]